MDISLQNLKFFLFVLLLFVVISAAEEEFNPHRVHLVDYNFPPNATQTQRVNAIFRTNIPITNHKFDYDRLTETLRSVAIDEGSLLLPSEFHLIDVSLLKSDDNHVKIERQFFSDNPELGEFVLHTILGTNVNPNDYSDSELRTKSENLNWMNHEIEEIVERLDRWMNNFESEKSIIVVIHCLHGRDRTGEVSGAYWIAKAHRGWEQVMATNWEIRGGELKYINQRALTWYCHHLAFHQGYTDLSCSHDNLDDKSIRTPVLLGWDITDSEVSGLDGEIIWIIVLSSIGLLFVFCIITGVILFIVWNPIKEYASSLFNTEELDDEERIVEVEGEE